jgi:hypothetical protein
VYSEEEERPIISWMIRPMSTSATAWVATFLPSLNTVTRSAISKISPRLCEM